MRIQLFAVIGPLEAHRVGQFLAHYRGLGVEEIYVTLHFPGLTEGLRNVEAECRRFGATIVALRFDPWHESSNKESLAAMRADSESADWHLVADADELQQYPGELVSVLRRAERAGGDVVRGVLLDRFASNGCFPSAVGQPLDAVFPLGAFFTSEVLGGDPRKVVALRPTITTEIGQHWSRNGKAPDVDLAIVHHFKWVDGVVGYLELRNKRFAGGEWVEESSAMREEVGRLIRHLANHDGQISTTDPLVKMYVCRMDVHAGDIFENASRVAQLWDRRFGEGS
jgi:Glycosyl transferase family 2